MKKHKLPFLLAALPALCACAALDVEEKRAAISPSPPDKTWDVPVQKTSAPPSNPITPDAPDSTWVVPVHNPGAPAAR